MEVESDYLDKRTCRFASRVGGIARNDPAGTVRCCADSKPSLRHSLKVLRDNSVSGPSDLSPLFPPTEFSRRTFRRGPSPFLIPSSYFILPAPLCSVLPHSLHTVLCSLIPLEGKTKNR